MIAWLKGTLLFVDESSLVVDCNNVGYSVIAGGNAIQNYTQKVGQEVEFHIYTAVKEDDIRLFGFENIQMKQLFLLLLKVNGVGPKLALGIIDQIPTKEIVSSIYNGDHRVLLSASGVGKKTAQRIIVDLQGKLTDDFSHLTLATTKREIGETDEQHVFESILPDAKSALLNLGFQNNQVDQILKKHLTSTITLEELIRKCLLDLKGDMK